MPLCPKMNACRQSSVLSLKFVCRRALRFQAFGWPLQSRASNHGYQPKDGSDDAPGGGGRNQARDFNGATRSTATDVSTTDPEAKMYRCRVPALGPSSATLGVRSAALAAEITVSGANRTAERLQGGRGESGPCRGGVRLGQGHRSTEKTEVPRSPKDRICRVADLHQLQPDPHT